MFASLSLGLVVLPFVFAAVHDVQVGADGITFTPEALSADLDDQVVFHFNPKNHSVTQTSFADPCGIMNGGFNSGFMPVAANASKDTLPVFTVNVTTTNPIWINCQQGAGTVASHCGMGMIFAINCPSSGTNSFDNFKSAALAVGASLTAAAASATASVASTTFTAPYGDVTVPPVSAGAIVTEVISLDSSSVWTTTYSSYPGSPNPTPASAQGDVIEVTVGGNGSLTFDPPHVNAKPRDVVVFTFAAKNHTLTQSAFADPCRPLNGTGGIDSGFMPVSNTTTELPSFNVTVNDTAPLWFYCKQKTPVSHCGTGMVFAINSVEDSQRNFSAFQSLAKQLNGTTSNSTSGGSSGTNTDAALSVRVGSAGLTVAAVAALALIL